MLLSPQAVAWLNSMVATMEITKVTARDRVVIDLAVWMDDPTDHDFQPRVHLDGSSLTVTNEGYADTFASEEIDDDTGEACERDRRVELRVKFQVEGMHGKLLLPNPIPADGKGKKLAEPRWKTIVPIL